MDRNRHRSDGLRDRLGSGAVDCAIPRVAGPMNGSGRYSALHRPGGSRLRTPGAGAPAFLRLPPPDMVIHRNGYVAAAWNEADEEGSTERRWMYGLSKIYVHLALADDMVERLERDCAKHRAKR